MMKYLIILILILNICACGKSDDSAQHTSQPPKTGSQTLTKATDKGKMLMKQLATISSFDPNNPAEFDTMTPVLESTVGLLRDANFIDHFSHPIY